jgi:hypothetical protein
MLTMDFFPPAGSNSSVHPETPTLTRHLLASLSSRQDVNGGELFR